MVQDASNCRQPTEADSDAFARRSLKAYFAPQVCDFKSNSIEHLRFENSDYKERASLLPQCIFYNVFVTIYVFRNLVSNFGK